MSLKNSMKSKKRTPYRGMERNVENKKKDFKAAVGRLITTKGTESLTLNKISTEASISKNLIHRYFGNHNNLIDQYCEETEFWLNSSFSIKASTKKEQIEQFKDALRQQFYHLYDNPEARKLMIWEIDENNDNTSNLSRKKEELGEIYLDESERIFSDTVDIRAIYAVLVSAINYLSARAAVQDRTFCGITLHAEEDRIFKIIDNMLDLMIKP